MSEADTAAPPAAEKTVTEQLDALFAPWNHNDAPGLVVGVVRDGALLYRRGFGMASLETAVALTPRTRMRIGSTSKHFTCLLALLLAEEGKLDLDAPIRAYLPELTGPGGDPSLRLLLQHRGGSRCFIDVGGIAHGAAAPAIGAALATQVRQNGRNFAPGEAMIYNNGGYHLVSIAIERIGGAPFETQLNDRLFAPVGMSDTASIPSDYEITPGIATMHTPLPGGGWRRGLFPSRELRGEGAIVSTLDDMLRWMAHLKSRHLFGSAATWQALEARPVYAGGAVGIYALGLMLQTYRGLHTVHHAGGVVGGSSQMMTVPAHGLDIMIIANGAKGAVPTRLAEQIIDIVLSDEVGAPPASVATQDFEALLGDWWSPDTGMIYGLVDEEGVLKLRVCKIPTGLPLERTLDGRVISPAFSIGEIELGLDAAAAGGGLSIAFGGKSALYRRISKDDADLAAFAEAAAGRYFSPDADATATLVRDGARLLLHMTDPYGGVETELVAAGDTVAFADSPTQQSHWALSFIRGEGGVTGFHLNTMRTRGLTFTRREAASV